MKKLLALLLLGACSSDSGNYKYNCTYVVFYPNYQDTQVIETDYPLYFSSDRGSNYIREGDVTGPRLYNSSAPYKVLSYTKTLIK